MPAELLSLLTATTLGFLHALEVDHLVAVTTYVSRRPTLAAAAGFGVRWGLGHSLAVLVVGGVLLASGMRWPAGYDAIGEAAVGVMLIGLGLWPLRSSRKLPLHPAQEHGGEAHRHLHARGDRRHSHHQKGCRLAAVPPSHRHGYDVPGHRSITLVGLLHGLAGTTGVVALLPLTLGTHVGFGLGYLSLFGVGVTAAMTLFASVAAVAVRRANERSLVLGRRLTWMIGGGSVGVGVWWLWMALAA